jgi:hypothetical protein
MFEVTKIQDSLEKLVGIRQPANPDLTVNVDSDNKISESGLFLDDIPPFNFEAIYNSQDYVGINSLDQSLDFNTYLRNIKRSSIANVVTQVFDKPSFIDRSLLFINESPRLNSETFPSEIKYYGYEIEVSNTKNIGFKITRANFQFDFDPSTLNVNVYLFNSNVNAPLFSKQVTLTSNNVWDNLDFTVDSTLNDYKGSYFLLVQIPTGERLQPWKRDFEDGNFENNVKELEIERVLFNDTLDVLRFNSYPEIETSQNVGINLDITVFNDYTDLIIQNKFLFSKVVQLQTVVTLMMKVATSMRSNRDERQSKELTAMIMTYVNGVNANGDFNMKGLNKSIPFEIESLRKEIASIRDGYFGDGVMVDTLS